MPKLTRTNGTLALFDETPIRFLDERGRNGFVLRHRAVDILGKPSQDEFLRAYLYAKESDENAPYWLGELARVAETRKEWAQLLDRVVEETGISRQRAINLASVVKRVDRSARSIAPSPSHAEEVAALPPEEQIEFLTRANEEEWSQRELREQIRASKRRKVLTGRAVLEGQHRVLFADPPWLYDDSGPTADGSLGKAARHYQGMPMKEIIEMPVKAHTTEDAILFLCVTEPMVYQNPGPREVIEAWGFEHRTGFVWDKVLGNPGHYGLHIRHEHVFVCVRGRHMMPDIPTPQQDSVWTIRRSDEHSEKPVDFLRWIQKHWTVGPYLYLFASEPHEGWTCFGDDFRLHEEATASS